VLPSEHPKLATSRTTAQIALWQHTLNRNTTYTSSVEEIHSVGMINNVETSYFTQLKMCYLITTFRCFDQDVIKMSDGYRNVVIR